MPTTKNHISVRMTDANLVRVRAQMDKDSVTSIGAFINRMLHQHVPGFERETEQGDRRAGWGKGFNPD